MDAYTAGQLCRSINAVHSLSYFLPDVAERFGALGMHGGTPYFAARSAPMGAVSAATVAATFYNFNPVLIAESIPAAWELASPRTVTSVRYEMVEAALPRVLGDLVRAEKFSRGALLLRKAAEAIPNGDGRPLYAGHAELAWPESPHGQMWHAVTLLREYRGDGHIAALVAHELSGIEALITHTLAGIGFSVQFAKQLRGWSEDQWQAGIERLQSRGLIDDTGGLSAAGTALRSRIEDATDQLGYAPWQTLSDDEGHELTELANRIGERVQAAQLFPVGAFGPRYGQPR
jgi:hypothetical protein